MSLAILFHFLRAQKFRTLIYPSSGACDYSVELPHWSYCSWLDVCWSFGVVGLEWYPCCRLKPRTIRPMWEEWKESIIIPIHKKGDKTDCSNCRGISLLPTTYEILSNILLSRLIPYAKEIIGDHQCGFRRNRSTIDHIFRIRQILEKKCE